MATSLEHVLLLPLAAMRASVRGRTGLTGALLATLRNELFSYALTRKGVQGRAFLWLPSRGIGAFMKWCVSSVRRFAASSKDAAIDRAQPHTPFPHVDRDSKRTSTAAVRGGARSCCDARTLQAAGPERQAVNRDETFNLSAPSTSKLAGAYTPD